MKERNGLLNKASFCSKLLTPNLQEGRVGVIQATTLKSNTRSN